MSEPFYEYRVVTRHGWERGELDGPRIGTWSDPPKTFLWADDADRHRCAWDEAPRFPDDVPHRVERRILGEWEDMPLVESGETKP